MNDYYRRDATGKANEWLKNPKNQGVWEFHDATVKDIFYVMTILYHEPKLNADDMRDLAQILNNVIMHGYR
jgi:hypothetical protein